MAETAKTRRIPQVGEFVTWRFSRRIKQPYVGWIKSVEVVQGQQVVLLLRDVTTPRGKVKQNVRVNLSLLVTEPRTEETERG